MSSKAAILSHLTLAALVLTARIGLGSSYVQGGLDLYDPDTGLYYKGVETPRVQGMGVLSGPGREMINVSIFDPATGASHLVFSERPKGVIAFCLFETGFKDGSILFNEYQSGYAKNDKSVPQRKLRDKLLVGVRDGDKTTLFVSDKHGNGLKPLTVLSADDDWHIDVRNSKLRVVRQTGEAVKLESFDW
jgi:hypothetical protein